MPWKIGGNFEIVTTKCEASWRECAIAIASYLWCEMVSDVVDCLGKHGMIWVLIVTIASTILLRIKHRRNMRTQNIVLGKQMFNKVGYKIHDLELKINILTYKMQYGTWPLPHQIYNLDSKKRKIKMTLSNPGDHKSWINRVLLSPMKNSMCVPYPNMFGPSEVKLQGTNYSPDVKEKHTVRHVYECNESPVHSSQETLHEVKKRLQILHNALKMYQNASQSSQEESKRNERKEGEIDASVTEAECKPDCNVDSQGNSRESQHSTNKYCECLVHSVGSLSSLTEYSSNTSRTYRYPSSDIVATRNPCSQDSRIVRKPVETSDLPAMTSPCDEQSSHLYSLSTLRASEDCTNCENKYVKDTWRCDHIVKSDIEISENITDANGSFEPGQKTSETISEGTCCILSSGPFEDENMSTQNGMSSSKFVETLDKETQKNAIASESSERVSNDSDREERPTALLLQEALHFKKVLLTRIDSAKEQLTRQDADSPGEYKEMNNFPSMILDIKRKEQPIINGSCDQMNQDYVYLEMKQRRDSFLRSGKPSILVQRDNKQESQDRICEASSKYFSITDLATENDDDVKIGSDVLLSLKPPIYEKVVSIMIPVETTSREIKAENYVKESSIERNLSENLRENPRVDDDNIAGFSPTMRKLEDLVIERIRSIRDYMDTFLRNQNEAISKVRRALQYQDGSDATLALRCSNEASHVMLHKRLIAIHNRDKCIDKAVSFSSDSPDLLLKAWPNHHEVLLENDVLKYCSNVCLRRNPEMFALVAPRAIKSEFSDNRNPPKTTVELAKQETVDPSISVTFERSYEKDAAIPPARKAEDELHPTKRTVSSPENDRTSKRKVVADTLSADFQKRERQRQDAESKSLASYYSLNAAETNPIIGSKITEIVKSHEKLPATSNDNSTSNSSSYFTNATASSVKMDDACSKSIFILEQSCAESILEQKTEHNRTINRENNSGIAIEESPSMNVKMRELSSNLEYSSLKTLVNSNLITGKSECDYSTRTMNGNDLISHDPDISFSSLNAKEKTLKINSSSSNMVQGNEVLIADSTGQLLQMHPRIKAKSDVSLDEERRRILNANLHPKRSLSLLTRHDLAHVQRTLHQSHINNIHLQCDNKDKFANQSMSVVSSQRVSTRSCIPISKNRLEHVHRARHQALAKSPTRGPLTVSCREKTLDKSHAENIEVAQRHGIPINRHLHAEEVPLDLIELEKDVFAKESKGTDKAKAACRVDNAMSRDMRSPSIDKEHARETKRRHDGKSDTRITERENATRRTVAVISIVADEDVRRNYSGNSFILKTENVCSASDFLKHKNKLWTITIERTERETATKPSITDTCTSMSEVALKTN